MTTIWTTERPTQPGEYWLSLSPDRRALAAKYPAGLERPVERVWIEGERLKTRLGWSMSLTAGWLDGVELLDGAKWSRRETPADPFAKTDPMRTDQDGREYNQGNKYKQSK